MTAARIRIGRMTALRGAPDALMTTSSESWFMVDSVCVIAMISANGITSGIADGINSELN